MDRMSEVEGMALDAWRRHDAAIPPCGTTIQCAALCASVAADEFGLPQTVYLNDETCGWWHTNSLSGQLSKSTMALTVLPRRYFS